MSKKLEGKVAVITGGNSGIGLAAAVRVADVGGAVVEALRRRDLSVRALVRRDDERVDALRATGAEVVVAPRSALTGTLLDPFRGRQRIEGSPGKSRSAAVRWAEASGRPMHR